MANCRYQNGQDLTTRLNGKPKNSISMSLLLLLPLLLQVCPNTLASQPELTEAGNPATTTSDYKNALPGEVLIKLAARPANRLYAFVKRENLVASEADLIGLTLDPTQFQQGLDQSQPLLPELIAATALDPALGLWRLRFSNQLDINNIITQLRLSREISYAEPNYLVQSYARQPNDPFYTTGQNYLRRINAPEAWDITTGSDKITIAMLDTGMAYAHPDLRDKITSGGRNFVAEPATSFAWDDHGHGTFMAGIAAASSNNNLGVSGVAWGAKLLPIKVLDYNQYGTIATLGMGLAYATTQPVQVVNISAGGSVRSRTLEEIAQKAFDRGLVLIAASGNSGKAEYNYPAAFDTFIAVGASDDQDRPASFTTYGNYLSVVAPGINVLSLNWASDREYAQTSGTSTAAPQVAGTAALMLSVNPGMSNREVRRLLQATADHLSPVGAPATLPGLQPTVSVVATATLAPVVSTSPGAVSGNALPANFDLQSGWGRLNVYRAVLAAKTGASFPNRTARLTGQIKGIPESLDATVTLEPGDTRYLDNEGRYIFAHLPPGNYQVTFEVKKYGLRSSFFTLALGEEDEELSINYDFSAEIAQILNGKGAFGAFRPVNPPPTDANLIYFRETGHILSPTFRNFWENFGRETVFGRAISEEFEENGKTVQYFERAILEQQPDYARTRFEIQPRPLGNLLAQGNTDSAFRRLEEPGKPQSNSPDRLYFDETGHSLNKPFLDFWKNNGSLNVFGFPISEPLELIDNTGRKRTVQYFERVRLDFNPDEPNDSRKIEVALLARDYAVTKGWIGR